MIFKILTLGLALITSTFGFSQIEKKEYKFGFDFVDGIYLSYNEFKSNNPGIRQLRVKVKNDFLYSDFTDEKRIDEIQGRNSGGSWITFKEDDIWGICSNDQIYIFVDKAFHKITKIGALLYVTIVFDDADMNVSFAAGDSYITPGNKNTIASNIIDFETGVYYLYNLKNFTQLLKKDIELFEEFDAISGKKQKKYRMLMYLEKFNDRNPIYFPVNPFQGF